MTDMILRVEGALFTPKADEEGVCPDVELK